MNEQISSFGDLPHHQSLRVFVRKGGFPIRRVVAYLKCATPREAYRTGLENL
jgi:hypothetical protein